MSDRLVVSGVEQLLELVELKHIQFNHYSVERVAKERDEDEQDEDDDGPNIGAAINLSERGTGLRVHVRMDYVAEHFTFSAIVEVEYTVSEPIEELDDDTSANFLGMSTMVSVIPFLREALQSAGSRLYLPVPVINLVRPQPMERVNAPVGDDDSE